MTTTKKTIQDPDLARVEAALQRAAKKARKTAKDTRTPLIIYKDGKIRRYILTTAVSTGLLMTRSNCELNLRQRPSWIFRKESFKAKLNSRGHTSWILKMKQTLYQGGNRMITDTEIKIKGLEVLVNTFGKVDAERFISLIMREPFDYTKWQRTLWEGKTIAEISRAASELREKTK